MPEPAVNPEESQSAHRALGSGPARRVSRYNADYWEQYGEDIERARARLAAMLWSAVPALRHDVPTAFDDLLDRHIPTPEESREIAAPRSRSYANNSSAPFFRRICANGPVTAFC